MSARKRLPNLRPSLQETVVWNAQVYTMTVGFDLRTGLPSEVFLTTDKTGTEMDSIMGDVAVLISIALQNGIRLTDLAKTVSRIPTMPLKPREIDLASVHTVPASPIGAALDAAIAVEEWAQRG